MSMSMRPLVITSTALVCALAGRAAAEYQYTILGPDGPVFRHVIEDPKAPCLAVQVKPRSGSMVIALPMKERFRGVDLPDQPRSNWPIVVCEAKLSYADAYNAASAIIDPNGKNLSLPLPKADAKKIGVIGDTGCRVKVEKGVPVVQDCLDPKKWPLPVIARTLADRRPDLVIHVGDYIYRKAPCPDKARCGDAPDDAHGTTWETLEAEIIKPAAPLMKAAPWVVPRGNHENCAEEKRLEAQGGIGFFILIDPRPFEEVTNANLDSYLAFLRPRTGKGDSVVCSACPEMTAPYIVPVDAGLDLWVIDSNHPEDEYETAVKDEHVIDEFAAQFLALSARYASRPDKRVWLTTHRPLYGLYPGSRKKLGGKGLEPPRQLNSALQEAFDIARLEMRDKLFDLSLTGHMHVFQVVSMLENGITQRPPNITVGNSGTQLDEHFADFPRLMNISETYRIGTRGPMMYASGVTIADRFGALWIERGSSGWDNARLIDPEGKPLVDCKITAYDHPQPASVTCYEEDLD